VAKRFRVGDEKIRAKEERDCLKEQRKRAINPKAESKDSRIVNSQKEGLTCLVY